MTLKITLTIDQENEQGTVLIGLLAKAFGRGEAGVSDLRIERSEGPRVQTAAPKLAVIARKVAAISKPKRNGYSLGMRAMKDGKVNGVIAALKALRKGGDRKAIVKAMEAAGLDARGGVGATLTKLAKRGLVNRLGDGVWKITPEGMMVLDNFEAKHESRRDGSVSGE